jgi:hypothetical protein
MADFLSSSTTQTTNTASANGSPVLSRAFAIPTNIAPTLSPTSDALTCFTQQQFSAKLQAFLVNYNISVNNIYSIFSR